MYSQLLSDPLRDGNRTVSDDAFEDEQHIQRGRQKESLIREELNNRPDALQLIWNQLFSDPVIQKCANPNKTRSQK